MNDKYIVIETSPYGNYVPDELAAGPFDDEDAAKQRSEELNSKPVADWRRPEVPRFFKVVKLPYRLRYGKTIS